MTGKIILIEFFAFIEMLRCTLDKITDNINCYNDKTKLFRFKLVSIYIKIRKLIEKLNIASESMLICIDFKI